MRRVSVFAALAAVALSAACGGDDEKPGLPDADVSRMLMVQASPAPTPGAPFPEAEGEPFAGARERIKQGGQYYQQGYWYGFWTDKDGKVMAILGRDAQWIQTACVLSTPIPRATYERYDYLWWGYARRELGKGKGDGGVSTHLFRLSNVDQNITCYAPA